MTIHFRRACPPPSAPSEAPDRRLRLAWPSATQKRRSTGGSTPNAALRRRGWRRPVALDEGGVQGNDDDPYCEATFRRLVRALRVVDGRMRGRAGRRAREVPASSIHPMTGGPCGRTSRLRHAKWRGRIRYGTADRGWEPAAASVGTGGGGGGSPGGAPDPNVHTETPALVPGSRYIPPSRARKPHWRCCRQGRILRTAPDVRALRLPPRTR
jgi:hypothetical protein